MRGSPSQRRKMRPHKEDIMSNMVVRTNIMSLNSHRNLGLVGNQQARASARLSSGFRINTGADDAAGLAISESMRGQIRGMRQGTRNVQDGISMIQTIDGFTTTIQELVQRANELAVQGANDTYDATQRAMINAELGQISTEITRIHDQAMYNRQTIFGAGGLADGAFHLQAGPDVANTIDIGTSLNGAAFTAGVVAVAAAINAAPTDHAGFQTMITAITTTFEPIIGTFRANLGAIENRLEFTMQNLDIAAENLSAAESRIRDADMALEMMRLTQANVLQQAATAMLAQANQAPQSILQLLG